MSSISIMEVLLNAESNLIKNGNIPFAVCIGKEQLHNAITLLKAGYSLDDDFDSSFDKFIKEQKEQ